MNGLPDGIHIKSSEHMDEVDDESVTLVVTSPPYNVDLAYEKGQTFAEGLQLMRDVLKQCDRKMIDGGRACINVASTGRSEDHDGRPKGYTPLFKYIIDIAYDIGWWMRGITLWLKGKEPEPGEEIKLVSKTSTAWGSFAMATNPVLRDNHEFILVFSKGSESIPPGDSGILPDEFISFTNAEWVFQPVTGLDHPAPFPDELARRCILLYSNKGDTVLDPFGGTATTYKVARFLGRKAITYEKNAGYVPVMLKRIDEPVAIQSRAWDNYQRARSSFPDLFDRPTRELHDIARRLGIKSTSKVNKYRLMELIYNARQVPALDDFVNQ